MDETMVQDFLVEFVRELAKEEGHRDSRVVDPSVYGDTISGGSAVGCISQG